MKICCAMFREGFFSDDGGSVSGSQNLVHGEKEMELDVNARRVIKAMMLNPGRQREAQRNIFAGELGCPVLDRGEYAIPIPLKEERHGLFE